MSWDGSFLPEITPSRTIDAPFPIGYFHLQGVRDILEPISDLHKI